MNCGRLDSFARRGARGGRRSIQSLLRQDGRSRMRCLHSRGWLDRCASHEAAAGLIEGMAGRGECREGVRDVAAYLRRHAGRIGGRAVDGHDGGRAAARLQGPHGVVPVRLVARGGRRDGEGAQLAALRFRPAARDEGGAPLRGEGGRAGTGGSGGSCPRCPEAVYDPRGRGGSTPSPARWPHWAPTSGSGRSAEASRVVRQHQLNADRGGSSG